MKKDFSRLIGDISKKSLIYILGAIGILLIIISSFSSEDNRSEDISVAEQIDYCTHIEEKLEQILPKIVNVGSVDVMVTAKNYGEITLAKNEGENNDEIIILSQKGGGEDIKVIKESYPEIQGVIIVAVGGKSDRVKNDLTEAIMALLSVEAHKIKVFERTDK